MERLGLSWVLVGGQPRCVSDYASVAPRKRPGAICPECGRALTLKLGRIRRHHAAHAPHLRCAATSPETALHSDLKFHIAAQLQAAVGSANPLRIHRQCEGTATATCDAASEELWLEHWDEVVVEARVSPIVSSCRPDILLRRQGRSIGAIEVLVSHAVSDDKAAALRDAGLPWVEIRANERLLDRASGWRIHAALPVERSGSADAFGRWRCEKHLRRATVLLAARVVDVYREGGVRDRIIYRVDEQLVEDSVRSLALRRNGREIARESADGTTASRRAACTALRASYASDVGRLTAEGAFADTPMRWASGDAAGNLVHEALSDLQPGDPTPLATRYPHRWFYARGRGQWFLPRDMRDVRWDRPVLDAFATHPAWNVSRSAVRERPVPEGSWSGFIFANRPVAASFDVGSGTPSLSLKQLDTIAIISLNPQVSAQERAVVLLTAGADDAAVNRIAASLRDAEVEQLWLSHPMDWSQHRSALPWAAAGRDHRGRGVVLIDGMGVFRAAAFARAFLRGDEKFCVAAVKRRMSSRVAKLGAVHRTMLEG